MGHFYETIGFSEDMTPETFDRIAVERAGVLWSGGYGFACPRSVEVIAQAPEWGTRVIGAQGMGNHGRIVLVGLTPRTRALLRQGKTRRLVEAGVPVEVARVAISMSYGMEPSVARLAAEAVEAVKARGAFSGDSHWRFQAWLGRESDLARELSFPRKAAAAAIAAEVVRRT
jgi:hypothetical protein